MATEVQVLNAHLDFGGHQHRPTDQLFEESGTRALAAARQRFEVIHTGRHTAQKEFQEFPATRKIGNPISNAWSMRPGREASAGSNRSTRFVVNTQLSREGVTLNHGSEILARILQLRPRGRNSLASGSVLSNCSQILFQPSLWLAGISCDGANWS